MERLIDGTYMPNHWLSESEIAVTLKMSRTPVRAAVARLEILGLLKTINKREVLVKTITAKESYDMLEVIYSFAIYLFSTVKPDYIEVDIEAIKQHLDAQIDCKANRDYLGYTKLKGVR